MKRGDIPYVVCATPPLPDAVPGTEEVPCCLCGCIVLRSPWNKDKKPVCMPCVLKDKNAEFYISEKDRKEAEKVIKRIEAEKN
jgi:hypothetical protein